MKPRCSSRIAVGLGVFAALLLSCVASAAFSARLVTDPKPVGPEVVVDGFVFEGDGLATARLAVRNASTNLLTIDGARSLLIAGAGEARPLSTLVGAKFSMVLLPGETASDTIDILAPMQAGDQLTLRLVWTLGAIVTPATWVWEIVTTTGTAVESAPQKPAAGPVKAPQPAAPAVSTPASSANAAGDFVVGLLGLALALALVGLAVWGLWSLTQ